MRLRILALAVALAVASAFTAGATTATAAQPITAPVTGTASGGGTFSGLFTLQQFTSEFCLLVDGEPEAETELGVVLEQRIRPCRSAAI